MPPRSEDELDAVTLHNYALVHMDEDPNSGLRKFNFLLSQPTFPPETFGNLLLTYCKLQYYDLAADVLAQNSHLHESHLGQVNEEVLGCTTSLTPALQELYEYLEATILVQSSPEEAYRKFDELSTKHIETLRKFTKSIQDARIARDNALIKVEIWSFPRFVH
jgi:tetratricopeptide repeat protein 30